LSKSTFIANSTKNKTLCGCGATAILADGAMTEEGGEYRLKGGGGCLTIDYGTIYDKAPTDYMDDTPCEPCLKRNPFVTCENDEETGECIDCTVSYPLFSNIYNGAASESPHGVLNRRESVLCSRMVIYRNAKIQGGNLNYSERAVFRSRKRNSLPSYIANSQGKIACVRAPACDAGNKRTCCSCATSPSRTRTFPVVGPYRGCEQRIDGGTCAELVSARDPLTPFRLGRNCFVCDEKGRTPVPPLKYMVTPCNFFSNNIDRFGNELDFGERRYIFGYEKISENWWFFEESDYENFLHEVINDDPLGGKEHTIVMHFEMRANAINCCQKHCPDFPEAGSIGCDYEFPSCTQGHNRIPTSCSPNVKNEQFYKDSDKREKKVKIIAAAGFTMECGSFDFQKICNDVWDEETE
jgi:hypothetical protein